MNILGKTGSVMLLMIKAAAQFFYFLKRSHNETISEANNSLIIFY